MNRHPWRTRTGLLAIVNALAGVGVALGFAADVVDPFTAVAVAVAAALADLGILRDGESETTPVDDPFGRDGLPLVPFGAGASSAVAVSAVPATLSDADIDRLYAEPNGTMHEERGAM